MGFYCFRIEESLLQCYLNHCKAISRNIDCHLLLSSHSVCLRLYKLSVVVVLEVWMTREDSTLCSSLKIAETAEVDSSLALETTAVTYLYIYLTLVSVSSWCCSCKRREERMMSCRQYRRFSQRGEDRELQQGHRQADCHVISPEQSTHQDIPLSCGCVGMSHTDGSGGTSDESHSSARR